MCPHNWFCEPAAGIMWREHGEPYADPSCEALDERPLRQPVSSQRLRHSRDVFCIDRVSGIRQKRLSDWGAAEQCKPFVTHYRDVRCRDNG